MTRALRRRHRAARARPARPRAAGLRVRRADRGADRRPRRRRPRLRGRRRRLLPRALAAVLRRAVAPRRRPDGPGRGRRGRRSQGGSARFRALEGARRRTRTRPGTSPWGRGRPGWHIECSAMAEAAPGRRARHPRRRRRPRSSRTTRTRRRRRWPRAAKPLARVWMHNGMLQLADEKMSKSVGNIRGLSDALDEVGRDALLLYFIGGHYRQPIAYSRERLDAAAASVAAHPRGRPPPASRASRPRTLAPLRDAFFDALRRRLQHRRRRWPRCSTGSARRTGARAPSATPSCARCSTVLGARQPAGRRRRTRLPRLIELAAPAHRGASGEGLCRGGPAARRGPRGGLGDPRRPRRPRARARGVIIYGRNAVTEALRGQRRVRRIWAVKGDWSGAPVTQASPADITARCGSDAHQGVCADVEEYRYANGAELLAAPEPFLVALDEVTDPQNLGAVCRTAEVAGATGVILPERRSAEVTPAVCKASAGAVEHLAIAQVRNLADFLRDAKAGGVLGLRRRRRRPHPVSIPGLPRRGRPGARRGGERPQAEGEGCVRRPRLTARPRAHRLAQRQRCRGGSYVRDLAATA